MDSADEALEVPARCLSSPSLLAASEAPLRSLAVDVFDFFAMATNGFLGNVIDLFKEFVLLSPEDTFDLQGNVLDLVSLEVGVGSASSSSSFGLAATSSMNTSLLSVSLSTIGPLV